MSMTSKDWLRRCSFLLLWTCLTSAAFISHASLGYDSHSTFAAEREFVGVCFVAGTPIATGDGPRAIETLQVGDRVLTSDPCANGTDVEPATWRRITLRMLNPEGAHDILNLELLRSEEWILTGNCKAGCRIWLDLDEMGLHGWADVLRIDPCPSVCPGAGRVVLGTVTHLNSCVLGLGLSGEQHPLELTDRHLLFSATRNAWVPASELQVGEELATRTSVVRVESKESKPGTSRVFNIEVEGEHCYFAGALEVLSHNTCAAKEAGSLTYSEMRQGGLNLTDRMSGNQFRKLVDSIKETGLQDKVINYVKIGDENYIVLGNNRVQAARQIPGMTDQLIFKEVQLPFRGFKTENDVMNAAAEVTGGY